MNITVIYGVEHKGSTYNTVQVFLNNLVSNKDKVTEFFLPKDMPHYCKGCFACFYKEGSCPHFDVISPIRNSLLEADLIIMSSPVYVYHVSGQMKALLDHFGPQWMVHRPEEKMFSKQALVISTAAGAGTRSTNKDIKDSLDFWGVAKTYTYGKNVAAANWKGVSEKIKSQINRDAEKICKKIKNQNGKINPSIKVKIIFYFMRFLHKKFAFNEPDVKYWKEKGWLDNGRPWR